MLTPSRNGELYLPSRYGEWDLSQRSNRFGTSNGFGTSNSFWTSNHWISVPLSYTILASRTSVSRVCSFKNGSSLPMIEICKLTSPSHSSPITAGSIPPNRTIDLFTYLSTRRKDLRMEICCFSCCFLLALKLVLPPLFVASILF